MRRAPALPRSRVAADLEILRQIVYGFVNEKCSVTADLAAALGCLARKNNALFGLKLQSQVP